MTSASWRVRSQRFKEPVPAYYVDLWKKARTYEVDMARKQWCDLSHTHLDWSGFGDRGWLHRRRHLSALLWSFARARRELRSHPDPVQVFASVHPFDAGSDAVYIHTPNPNGTPFPVAFGGHRLDRLPPLLAGRVDPARFAVFREGTGRDVSYTIVEAWPAAT